MFGTGQDVAKPFLQGELMRKAFLIAALLVACSKGETPVDTTAAVAPAAPANMTASDLAGTWNGTSTIAGTDSVVARWTTTSTSDSTGTLTYEGTKMAIPIRTVFDADSSITTSDSFAAPNAKRGAPMLAFRAVGRMQDGRFVGQSVTYLASNPDSVVARRNFEATKAP